MTVSAISLEKKGRQLNNIIAFTSRDRVLNW